MSQSKIFAFCAGCAISASVAVAAPSYTGQWSAYNDLLLTPAPHAGNTVDSPSRAENGRVWTGRAIGARQTIHAPGAASYGAPASEEDALIFVRVNNVSVAINPWDRIDTGGLAHLERARNLWLKENGYILGVRTFVNPRFVRADEAGATPASQPAPRATIRRQSVPAGPSKMQVRRPVSGQPIANVSKPGEIIHAPKTEIAGADAPAGE
jgi:hypothetical protein